jgi:hypothetical protein
MPESPMPNQTGKFNRAAKSFLISTQVHASVSTPGKLIDLAQKLRVRQRIAWTWLAEG